MLSHAVQQTEAMTAELEAIHQTVAMIGKGQKIDDVIVGV